MHSHPPRRGELAKIARAVGKSERTLRSWRSRGAEEGRPGRPPRPQAERAEAHELVPEVWRTLPRGHDGWRTASAALARNGTSVATRLVQESVRELKAERRERARRRIEERREHVVVLARNAVWGADETHLGRDQHGQVRALVVRETLVPLTLAASIGGPARGRDVVRVLCHAALERGSWPLVLMLDNGPANRCELVLSCLHEHQVVPQWNLPDTPEHNARTERGIGDIKRAMGLDGPVNACADPSQGHVWSLEPGVPRTREALRVRFAAAWALLDDQVPRAALGGLTPAELDSFAVQADHQVCRARFYEEVCSELARLERVHADPRARRMAQRDAIWRALQRHGVLFRTRGGRLVPALKAEEVL